MAQRGPSLRISNRAAAGHEVGASDRFRGYVIVTPVRDEELYIEKTLESVIQQTCRPVEWVIVDDSSTDETPEIVGAFAEKHSWIHLIQYKRQEGRLPGTGVVEAFNLGLSRIAYPDWEYIVKLDGDLSLPSDFFADCLGRFQEHPKLGIAGGAIYNLHGTHLKLEKTPGYHVRGATKIYRRACWESIGGLVPAPGWDTLDEVRANMLGWRTSTLQHLKVIHLRPTGSANGIWGNATKNGRANYLVGYHPLFMLLKCIRRCFLPPYVIGAVGLLWGYTASSLRAEPLVSDQAVRRYLRSQQLRFLLRQDSFLG